VESGDLQTRAARHAALGDAARLAIVDELARSDRSPVELRRLLGIESNLLAHHLDVLEGVGMIRRSRSSGDGRRRYVHLVGAAVGGFAPRPAWQPNRALFVCTRNSARSQLAAGLWRTMAQASADSAGTHPAARVHPGAVAAARRAGFELSGAPPRKLVRGDRLPRLVVTVCDQAHEELGPVEEWLHWSINDPVVDGSRAAFDATVADLRDRIESLLHASPVAS
jgi:protein-tyrosine-phosphatase